MIFNVEKYPNQFLYEKINVIKMEKEKYVEEHSHEFIEILYVVSGQATHHMNGNSTTLKAGDYIVIDYNTVHNYVSKSGFTIINCLFLPEIIDDSFKNISCFNELTKRFFFKICHFKINGTSSNQIFHDNDGTIKELFDKMVDEYKKRQIGCLDVLRYQLCECIIKTIRKIGTKDCLSPFNELLINTVQTQYSTHISLQEITQQAHYSLPYVSQKFKEEVGMTFTDFLQTKRIEESCKLIEETDNNISNIAEAVGYNDLKFFNKTFKKIMHKTPSEYKNSKKTKIAPSTVENHI